MLQAGKLTGVAVTAVGQSLGSSNSGSSCATNNGVEVTGRASSPLAAYALGTVSPGPSPSHSHAERLESE